MASSSSANPPVKPSYSTAAVLPLPVPMKSSSTLETKQPAPLNEIHHLITIKLDEQNYSSWRSQMVSILKQYDFYRFLDGTHPCPPLYLNNNTKDVSSAAAVPINPHYEQWKQEDQILLGLLFSSLSESGLSDVRDLRSSRDVWFTLEAQYSSNSSYTAEYTQIRRALQTISKGSLEMSEYYSKAENLANRLADLGHPMLDSDFQQIIINGLDGEASYGPFVKILTSDKVVLSMEEFREDLLAAEQEKKNLLWKGFIWLMIALPNFIIAIIYASNTLSGFSYVVTFIVAISSLLCGYCFLFIDDPLIDTRKFHSSTSRLFKTSSNSGKEENQSSSDDSMASSSSNHSQNFSANPPVLMTSSSVQTKQPAPTNKLHHPITIKLHGRQNYSSWRSQFVPIFTDNNFYRYLDGSHPCPSLVEPDSTDYKQWKQEDEILRGLLLSSLSESVRCYVQGRQSSRDVWVYIETIYSSLSTSRNPAQICRELQTIRKGSSSMLMYLSKAEELATRLAELGHPVSCSDLQQTILSGLDSTTYDPIVTTLTEAATKNNKVLSMEELRAYLQAFDDAQQKHIGKGAIYFFTALPNFVIAMIYTWQTHFAWRATHVAAIMVGVFSFFYGLYFLETYYSWTYKKITSSGYMKIRSTSESSSAPVVVSSETKNFESFADQPLCSSSEDNV